MANAVVNIKELKFRRLILDTHTHHTHTVLPFLLQV